MAGQIDHIDMDSTIVGAGYTAAGASSWPSVPAAGTDGNNYFTGDVAVYDHTLGTPAIAQQWQSGHTAATELTSITLPSGKSKLAVTYDAVNDRASTFTDANGGTWTLHNSTVTGSTQQYRASVLGSGPAGYWRLSDPAGTQAANQIYADRTTPNNGTYANTTLGAAGPFPYIDGQANTHNSLATGFDGATS